MPKTISANLKSHLAENVTTLATCWRLARQDGQEYFFTDHDVDIEYDGDTYEAASGMLPQALQQNDQMAVDNQSIVAFLESDKITEADIRAGLFNYASIDVFIINYNSTGDGVMYLAKDWQLGEIEIRDNSFTAEARGKAQHLAQHICDLYSGSCRVDLGSTECGVSLGSSVFSDYNGNVESVGDARRSFTDSGLIIEDSGGADPIYQHGLLTWTSPGANAGYQMEVKRYDPSVGEIELFDAMPNDIEVGDGFTVTYGCDKDVRTCFERFNNVVNFRGEPFIPGPDMALEIIWKGRAGRRGSINPFLG